MKTVFTALTSLFVGVLTFLVVLVGATELLDPHVWPALILSIPMAIVAGVIAVGFSALGLRYRAEKREAGRASRRTVALLWGFAAGTATFVVVAVATTVALGAFAMPLLSAMLLGSFPAGTVLGILVGLLVVKRLGQQRVPDGDSGSRPTA